MAEPALGVLLDNGNVLLRGDHLGTLVSCESLQDSVREMLRNGCALEAKLRACLRHKSGRIRSSYLDGVVVVRRIVEMQVSIQVAGCRRASKPEPAISFVGKILAAPRHVIFTSPNSEYLLGLKFPKKGLEQYIA